MRRVLTGVSWCAWWYVDVVHRIRRPFECGIPCSIEPWSTRTWYSYRARTEYLAYPYVVVVVVVRSYLLYSLLPYRVRGTMLQSIYVTVTVTLYNYILPRVFQSAQPQAQ